MEHRSGRNIFCLGVAGTLGMNGMLHVSLIIPGNDSQGMTTLEMTLMTAIHRISITFALHTFHSPEICRSWSALVIAALRSERRLLAGS